MLSIWGPMHGLTGGDGIADVIKSGFDKGRDSKVPFDQEFRGDLQACQFRCRGGCSKFVFNDILRAVIRDKMLRAAIYHHRHCLFDKAIGLEVIDI